MIRRSMLVMTMAGTLAAPHVGNAQVVAVSDSLTAAQEGKTAAKKPRVAGYFLGGFIVGPFAIGSVGAIASGEGANPLTIGSPLLFIALGAKASHSSPLPAGVRSTLQGRDSGYVRAFTRSYNTTLNVRRQTAVVVGSLTGVVALFVIVLMTIGD